jgi:indolepyruvate ferredoxin oxidoreductase beta subunit
MPSPAPAVRSRITLAILALGGQGGGVLADWLISLAEAGGWIVQATSVPGVAQRTGSTVYYLEFHPAGADARAPVLALMPAPGDVDIVIASELMEAGRAMVRGFVTDRTTLISSTHRIYAMAEKSAMGDGARRSDVVLAAAKDRAARFIGLDMDAAAARTGSVISAVMFGALAGGGALPFGRPDFEAAILTSGKAVKSNLAGFEAGFAAASGAAIPASPPVSLGPTPTTKAGEALHRRIIANLPPPAQVLATEGVRRLMDYQDADYAALYLDRLEALAAVLPGQALSELARHLALWMSYEDVIRVADLKTRASRFGRVRGEVGVSVDQPLGVTEFMRPRFEEICDTLPLGLGRRAQASPWLRAFLAPLFAKGRHVRTSSIRGFLMLVAVAGLRRWRRGTLRDHREQTAIEAWLSEIAVSATIDPALAAEVIVCQRLVKGYGDTHARGLANFNAAMAAARRTRDAGFVRRFREAALADEDGLALSKVV